MDNYDKTPQELLEETEAIQSLDKGERPARRVPWWMTALIIAMVVPGAVFPWTIRALVNPPTILLTLTWIYPLYVLISGGLAWQCYGRRTVMTWIILVLLMLTHLCFYYLTFTDIKL